MVRRTSDQATSPLDKIWAGMPVVDAEGRLVGTVKDVVPTPEANLLDLDADGPERVPHGMLKVAGAGLMDNDCYVHAQQIAAATEDQILLSVLAADLSVEYGHWI